MLSEQQRALTNSLRQAILRLCHDGVPHLGKIEVDGIICIHVEEEPHDLIIKLHESLFKTTPVVNNESSRALSSVPANVLWRQYPDNQPSGSYLNKGSNSQHSLHRGPELRDLLSQSRQSHFLPSSSGDINNQTTNQNSSFVDDLPVTDDVNDEEEMPVIVQAPLYRQLWDKYKSSGSGGGATRGMKVPQVETATSGSSSVVLPCKICRTMVSGIDKLEKHYSAVHKVHMCKQCFRTFSMYSNLKRHMRLHTGQRPYRCTICGKSFTRKDDLTNHILKHKDAKPFQCGVCKKGYTERSSIRGHLRRDHSASTDDIHICTQCGIAYADLTSFVSHLKTHSKSSVSGHCAFVQEHSSVIQKEHSNNKPKTSYSLFEFDSLNHEGHCERLSPHDLLQPKFDIVEASNKGGKGKGVNQQNNLPGSPLDLSHVSSNTNQKQMLDVIVSRPDGSPCSVSVKVGHLALSPESSNPEYQSQSPNVSHLPVKISLPETFECKDCPAKFCKRAEFLSHIVEVHQKYICTHCPDLSFDTSDELTVHMSEQHVEETKENGQSPSRYELGGMKETAVKDEPMEGESGPETTVKIKHEVEEVDESNEDGSEFRDSPTFMSSSQPVFPGSPLLYQPDRAAVIPSSSTATDFAMSKSSDSHSFGRIIEIKPMYSSNGSGMKKIRLGGTKQVFRDHQGELMCPPSYQCSCCKEVFNDTEEFLNHCTDAHQRYGCKYCGQMFTQCGNRNRHLRYHSGDRPFVCQECGDNFARQDALKNHIDARHKKATCPICGLVFAKAQLASQHLKNEHSMCVP